MKTTAMTLDFYSFGYFTSIIAMHCRFLERSYKDMESINLELNKELRETKVEHKTLQQKVSHLSELLEKATDAETASAEKVVGLQEKLADVMEKMKIATAQVDILEKGKMDFDMRLELAIENKTAVAIDLKKCLE